MDLDWKPLARYGLIGVAIVYLTPMIGTQLNFEMGGIKIGAIVASALIVWVGHWAANQMDLQ